MGFHGALFLQVPQIVACYRAKSVQGLSATSIYASLLAPMTYTIYSIRQGNEWHTWAENVVLVAQNMVLIVMVWMYSTPKVPHSTKSMVCSFIVGLAVMSYSVPDSHQYLLPLMNIPFLLSSRIPQIMENFKNGSDRGIRLHHKVSVDSGFAGADVLSVRGQWKVRRGQRHVEKERLIRSSGGVLLNESDSLATEPRKHSVNCEVRRSNSKVDADKVRLNARLSQHWHPHRACITDVAEG